jgi:hypothetical protein
VPLSRSRCRHKILPKRLPASELVQYEARWLARDQSRRHQRRVLCHGAMRWCGITSGMNAASGLARCRIGSVRQVEAAAQAAQNVVLALIVAPQRGHVWFMVIHHTRGAIVGKGTLPIASYHNVTRLNRTIGPYSIEFG